MQKVSNKKQIYFLTSTKLRDKFVVRTWENTKQKKTCENKINMAAKRQEARSKFKHKCFSFDLIST